MSCCAIAKYTMFSRCRRFFWVSVSGHVPLLGLGHGGEFAGRQRLQRETALARLHGQFVAGQRQLTVAVSGSARRMSSSLRAATVVYSLSEPRQSRPCVRSALPGVSRDERWALLASLRIGMFARMGSVWRLSTMPATVDSGFSNASRVVCASCMFIPLEFVPTRAGYG